VGDAEYIGIVTELSPQGQKKLTDGAFILRATKWVNNMVVAPTCNNSHCQVGIRVQTL